MGSYLSIISLHVNRLNDPTKRKRLAEWIQKQDPYIFCLQDTHFEISDTYRLKVKGWKIILKNIIQENANLQTTLKQTLF